MFRLIRNIRVVKFTGIIIIFALLLGLQSLLGYRGCLKLSVALSTAAFAPVDRKAQICPEGLAADVGVVRIKKLLQFF